MAADVLGDDTVEALLHKNLMFTQLIDKALGVILTLLYRHQVASDHNSGEAPEIGDFVFFRHSEHSPMQRINRWKLGMIQAVSSKSMDGLSRSYYVQSRPNWEEEGGDQRLNPTVLYHRCSDDIILLLSARDKISNQLFRADLQKQQELLEVTQQTSKPDLGMASAVASDDAGLEAFGKQDTIGTAVASDDAGLEAFEKRTLLGQH